FRDRESGTGTTTVNVGDTVQWDWVSGFHSTTGGSGPEAWDSLPQRTPFSFSHTFAVPGTYGYLCTVHTLIMLGTVTVGGAAANTIRTVDTTAAPGDTALVPLEVNLLPDVIIATLQLNLTVVPQGSAPQLVAPISFTSGLSVPPSLAVPQGNETLLIGWFQAIVPPLALRQTIGTLAVPIPPGAVGGDRYLIDVRSPS